jgi:hypothetical protein
LLKQITEKMQPKFILDPNKNIEEIKNSLKSRGLEPSEYLMHLENQTLIREDLYNNILVTKDFDFENLRQALNIFSSYDFNSMYIENTRQLREAQETNFQIRSKLKKLNVSHIIDNCSELFIIEL